MLREGEPHVKNHVVKQLTFEMLETKIFSMDSTFYCVSVSWRQGNFEQKLHDQDQ